MQQSKAMAPPKTTSLVIVCILLSVSSVHCQRSRGNRAAQSPDIVPRITHGEDAPIGRFPYMCSLRVRGSRRHRCGGTLIRRRWVLTAAHCVDPDVPRSVGLSPLVYCGSHLVDVNDRKHIFRAKRTYVHDSWNGSVRRGHDIALIELDRKADFSLPDVDFQGTRLESGQSLTATGWGRTQARSTADVLQMAQSLLYVPHNQCRDYHGVRLSRHTICAGFLDQDTCTGDSGGPLIVTDQPDGNITAGSPSFDLVIGITSAGSEDCDGSVPGLYTRVSDHAKWIRDVLNGTVQESPSPSPVDVPSVSDNIFRVGIDDPDDTEHDLKANVTSWSRLKRNAGYFTESGLYRGGMWRSVRHSEIVRSSCEIHSTSDCLQWSFVQPSHGADDSGICACNSTGTPYCASWNCEPSRKDEKADCLGRANETRCATQHHANTRRCGCVAPSPNERYCSHWSCTDKSASGHSQQDSYYCMTEDESGEYCYRWRGNMSSSYEVEAASCECFVRQAQYCLEWRCIERRLTRCAAHSGGWCSLEIAILVGGLGGLLTGWWLCALPVVANDADTENSVRKAVFACCGGLVCVLGPWLVGVIIWGGIVGFFSVGAIWLAVSGAGWYAVLKDEMPF